MEGDITILVITTGGTIDAEKYETTPENVTVGAGSRIPEAMESLQIEGGKFEYHHYCEKDSKFLLNGDISAIAEYIKNSPHNSVIVTTGTDKMPEISRELASFLKGIEKKVIVTGAMTPLSHGESSDGYGNLCFAVESLNIVSPGVHVVMHSQLFKPEGLVKNSETKTFHQEPLKT